MGTIADQPVLIVAEGSYAPLKLSENVAAFATIAAAACWHTKNHNKFAETENIWEIFKGKNSKKAGQHRAGRRILWSGLPFSIVKKKILSFYTIQF